MNLQAIKKAGRFILFCFATWAIAATASGSKQVVTVVLDDVISPATAGFVHQTIRDAQNDGTALIVIRMDTPGGLDSSMRSIIRDILASKVPVVAYVSPDGARAASAGMYILYASHVAAMAPATNLGAATPVALGGGKPGDALSEEKTRPQDASAAKAVNDAAAYVRSLAELRGRNVEFAERAVREAVSLSAQEALQSGVIEIVAVDEKDLLAQLDGRELEIAGKKIKLATQDAVATYREPDLRHRFLALIANPQIALILMMLGVYGLFFEFTSPGFGVPGVAGIICLLIGLYALQMMPVNWVGVALLMLGLCLMIAEAFTPSFGVLGVGGIIAFVVGGIFLIDGSIPEYSVSPVFAAGLGVVSATVFFFTGGMALRSYRRPVVSGSEEMIGMFGVVSGMQEDGVYWVQVLGERWRAVSELSLEQGQSVRIERRDGLTLFVTPI